MIHPRNPLLVAGIALLAASLCRADETFPVVHNEPITVRIVGGINGMPLSNLHLTLIGGYDQSDLHDQLYREEVLTDAMGNAHLPRQLANLPWLQVWVGSMPLCQRNPRKTSFSVELIRRDGLSAPNLCGPVTAEESPGVFTVFVKNKAEKLKKGVSITVRLPFTATRETAALASSATKVASPVVPNSISTPVQSVVVPVAVVSTQAPIEVAPKVTPIASTPAPASAHPVAYASDHLPVKPVTHLQHRRVGSKNAPHKAKPAPAACSVPPPAVKTHPTPPAKNGGKKAQPLKVPLSAKPHSKPLAGVRVETKKPAHSADLKKME
ncbi:MAG: hypothetical protein WB424_09415 [Terracidiphilus sp.]